VRLVVAFLFCIQSASLAQQVKWISFEELPAKMRAEARPILIFIHTDWCKYCALQENKTFTDSLIARVLNEKYYALKLNAEDKKSINFLGKEYRYKPNGASSGEHELAVLLGKDKGTLSFPTTVFLSDTWQIIGRKSGLMDAKNLLHLIR
jgi:thioredoxin-related protein